MDTVNIKIDCELCKNRTATHKHELGGMFICDVCFDYIGGKADELHFDGGETVLPL